MTDMPPQTPPAAPVPFEPSSGAIEFVHNGIMRLHFPDGGDGELVIRVRRPFLGELKSIRLELEDIRDDLAVLAATTAAAGHAMREEATALSDRLGDGDITPEEHAEQLREIRARDRASAQIMDDTRDDRTLEWWARILTGVEQPSRAGLALDPVPDVMSYPAWILDPRLPQLVLNHWRQLPSGPG